MRPATGLGPMFNVRGGDLICRVCGVNVNFGAGRSAHWQWHIENGDQVLRLPLDTDEKVPH